MYVHKIYLIIFPKVIDAADVNTIKCGIFKDF